MTTQAENKTATLAWDGKVWRDGTQIGEWMRRSQAVDGAAPWWGRTMGSASWQTFPTKHALRQWFGGLR